MSVARTMSRARLDDLNANQNLSYNENPADDVNYTGDVGNTALKPILSRNYDLSYENYFSDTGYLAAALFYKDLETFIFNQTEFVDISDELDIAPGDNPIARVSSPQNGNGGWVRGIELSLSMTGDMFWDSLEGFGFIVNGTLNDSEVKETNDSEPRVMEGLSDKTFNATFYYENYGFSARISSRYRSEFLGEVTAISMTRTQVTVDAENVFDAQIGYNFSDSGISSLEGLSLIFQVSNVTDEAFRTYLDGDTRLTRDYQKYGRNYILGANYKF